jgi:exopolyphosphatase/pppGpp-phosphohydrolase
MKDTPITLLHIGETTTSIALGNMAEPDEVLVLNIGFNQVAQVIFKHTPPREHDIEQAIMMVEDEIMRVVKSINNASVLYISDESFPELSVIAGNAAGEISTFSIEIVERNFDLLIRQLLGKAATNPEIQNQPVFAAKPLVLREFMHHLQFESIRTFKN